MAEFKLTKKGYTSYTSVPDYFIDHYMPTVNGEYVKVYLYLLRCLQEENVSLSISSLADVFQDTENDIKRALKYWEKNDLLKLEFDSKKNLKKISIIDPPQMGAALPIQSEEPAAAPKTPMEQAEQKQLLFVCEHYLARPLSSSEMQTLMYFYDNLHFSTDLIEYLVEYSVSKGKKSLRYMEKVALAWHEKGINTVNQAKEDSKAYSSNCYMVLKALGNNNHDPLPGEVEYIERWSDEYGFTIDIIIEACNRTIMQIHKPEFKYVNQILTDWKNHGVKHFKDIAEVDKEYLQKKEKKPDPTSLSKGHDFEEHKYDFESLDKQLFIN